MASVYELYEKHVNPGWAKLVRFMGLDRAEHHAEGCLVYDEDGVAFLDCLGGPGVFTAGHRHPAIVAAVHEQLDRMPLSSHLLLNPVQAQASERLAAVTPGDLQYSFLCNSGAEANEGALKLARASTGRPGFVSAIGGFHGKTLGALSVSGREVYRRPFEPLLSGCVLVPFGDVDALAAAVNQDTAAVLLEPIQGENGIIVPPDEYLPAAREICSEAGALLILDEVQTGLARTGKWFACQWCDVEPDILVLGKALGGGVMPAGAFMAGAELWEVFAENPLIHSSTFGGNPLACAALVAMLRVIEEENLCDAAAARGAQLQGRLQELKERFAELVLDVRGRGVLVGVEFADADIAGLFIAGLVQRRVLAAYGLNNPKVVRFAPPAVISEEQVEQVAAAADGALQQTAEVLDTIS